MTVTVFTPTYNRAYRLTALYESLKKQTNKDFEWLIVDDGSIDHTDELIKPWLQEQTIIIRYIKQQNGGKHRAINHGVQEANGELFFIVDSDDILPKDAVETILRYYADIKERKEFAGLCGLKAYYNGMTVGGTSDFGVIDCSNFDIDYKFRFKGDMAEVFRTNILKEYPFPEIEGERFCPEILVWNRISCKYIIRYFSDKIYYCEYLEDGLTSKITKIRMQSPVASCMTYYEMVQAPIPLWAKVRASINYWRFKFNTESSLVPCLSRIWRLTKPLGYLFYKKDRKNNRTCIERNDSEG